MRSIAILGIVLALQGQVWADTSFARGLVDTANATFGQGVRAVYMLDTGANKIPDFDACLVHLVKRKIVSLDWDLQPDQPLVHGRLAWMMFKALNLKGGATLRFTVPVFGLSERYAYRECTSIKVLAAVGQDEFVSGEALLTAIRLGRRYKETGKVE